MSSRTKFNIDHTSLNLPYIAGQRQKMSSPPPENEFRGGGDSFLLQWKNFSTAFLSNVADLRDAEMFSDATVLAGERSFHTHRIILSAGSLYFRKIFSTVRHNLHNSHHPVVIVLKDVDPVDFEAVLQFLYLGKVHVEQENLASFLKTAESLQIRGLTETGSKRKAAAADAFAGDEAIPPQPKTRNRAKLSGKESSKENGSSIVPRIAADEDRLLMEPQMSLHVEEEVGEEGFESKYEPPREVEPDGLGGN